VCRVAASVRKALTSENCISQLSLDELKSVVGPCVFAVGGGKVGMDADGHGGLEERGVERLWLLEEASSVVRAVGGGHLSGGEYSSCPRDIIIHYFYFG